MEPVIEAKHTQAFLNLQQLQEKCCRGDPCILSTSQRPKAAMVSPSYLHRAQSALKETFQRPSQSAAESSRAAFWHRPSSESSSLSWSCLHLALFLKLSTCKPELMANSSCLPACNVSPMCQEVKTPHSLQQPSLDSPQ